MNVYCDTDTSGLLSTEYKCDIENTEINYIFSHI